MRHAKLRERVEAIEIPDVRRVRFMLKEPSTDFVTFYATALVLSHRR
jgi:hypothetical protein